MQILDAFPSDWHLSPRPRQLSTRRIALIRSSMACCHKLPTTLLAVKSRAVVQIQRVEQLRPGSDNRKPATSKRQRIPIVSSSAWPPFSFSTVYLTSVIFRSKFQSFARCTDRRALCLMLIAIRSAIKDTKGAAVHHDM